MLFLAVCVLGQTKLSKPWNEHRFNQLAQDRANRNWTATSGEASRYGVGQETLGGAGCGALYPVGETHRRYMFSYDEGPTGELVYEQIVGRKFAIVWKVAVKANDPWTLREQIDPHITGTLNRYLAYYGWYVADPSRLTNPERWSLVGFHSFAVIMPSERDAGHPPDGTFIGPDGRPTGRPANQQSGYDVTDQEKAALRSRG